MWTSLLALIIGFCTIAPSVSGLSTECQKQYFHSKDVISCPGPENLADHVFCCEEYTANVHCCDKASFLNSPLPKGGADENGVDDDDDDIPLLSDSKAERRSVVKGLAKLIGIILGVAAFVIILCVVCCCCCPFCCLYKRKNRGEVLNTNPGVVMQQPSSGYYQIPQAGQLPPMPPGPGVQPYPMQQGYPPQQPYPPQPQPGYPDDSQMPYPAAPPPYPGPPTDTMVQQGPEPPQKLAAEYQTQPAYNPSAP